MPPRIILASASRARADILAGAGIDFHGEASGVDEDAIKLRLSGESAATADIAWTLAEAKAVAVSERHAGALVIGADQILECDGVCFDKPPDMARAAEHLRLLRGRAHHLICAVCVVRDGQPLWAHVENPRLVMRQLDEDEIASYLRTAGDTVLESVGAYRLEGVGARLFTEIDGDYFTILGLPLLPLLGFLRGAAAIDL